VPPAALCCSGQGQRPQSLGVGQVPVVRGKFSTDMAEQGKPARWPEPWFP
jgi:hypothetical protein